MNKLDRFFISLPLAISMVGHGLIRLPKLSAFAHRVSEQFSASPLPDFLVLPFGYLLPILELLVGIFLLLMYQMRFTLYAGLLLIALLVFGSSMIENWGAISIQLVHGIYFVLLLILEVRREAHKD